MAIVKPFKGLIYDPAKHRDLSLLTAPPYDVISPSERNELYHKHSFNVIRLILGKDRPEDNEVENKYSRAKKYLNDWQKDHELIEDAEAAFYVYLQTYQVDGKNISRLGVIARVQVEEFDKGVILPHEKTLSKAKTDRLNLLRATRTNMSQVFGLYQDDDGSITGALRSVMDSEPVFVSDQDDDVKNFLWRLTDPAQQNRISLAFRNKKIYIADGHHRYETALNYYKECLGTPLEADGNKYVMMMLVDFAVQDLTILPTHRVLKNLPKINMPNFMDNLAKQFNVTQVASPKELPAAMHKLNSDHIFGLLYDTNKAAILELKDLQNYLNAVDEPFSDDWKKLDVNILQHVIFNKILNISGTNIENTIKFTPYADEAAALVAGGEYQLAFLMQPTKIEELKAVANNAEIMPQKSTYFYPKLLTGMVLNKLDAC